MYCAFVDEFGDFSFGTTHQSWRPVCGYAGLIVPAENINSFQKRFRELKAAIDHQIVVRAKIGSAARQRATQGGSTTFVAEIMAAIENDRTTFRSIKRETKGRDVFSSQYLRRDDISAAKKRTIYRLARLFLKLLYDHECQIIVYGERKDGQKWEELKQRRSLRAPEVEFMRGLVEVVNGLTVGERRAVQIFLDHHPKDDETKARKTAQTQGQRVDTMPQFQTRAEYAREVILERRLFEIVVQPPVSVKSHWSLFIQAADWVCTLISYLALYECDKKTYSEFAGLSNKVGPAAMELLTRKSNIRGLWDVRGHQPELPWGA